MSAVLLRCPRCGSDRSLEVARDLLPLLEALAANGPLTFTELRMRLRRKQKPADVNNALTRAQQAGLILRYRSGPEERYRYLTDVVPETAARRADRGERKS